MRSAQCGRYASSTRRTSGSEPGPAFPQKGEEVSTRGTGWSSPVAWLTCEIGVRVVGMVSVMRPLHSSHTLKGTAARMRSKADCRSVVTITMTSPASYVSRTFPCGDITKQEVGVLAKRDLGSCGNTLPDGSSRQVRGRWPHLPLLPHAKVGGRDAAVERGGNGLLHLSSQGPDPVDGSCRHHRHPQWLPRGHPAREARGRRSPRPCADGCRHHPSPGLFSKPLPLPLQMNSKRTGRWPKASARTVEAAGSAAGSAGASVSGSRSRENNPSSRCDCSGTQGHDYSDQANNSSYSGTSLAPVASQLGFGAAASHQRHARHHSAILRHLVTN